MGLLARLSSVAAPARPRANSLQTMTKQFWSGEPVAWFDQLVANGMNVSPDLALTLSAYYCGVTTIAYDLATLPAQIFKYQDDGGKTRVRPNSQQYGVGGIGHLAYLLRWQPNDFQTASEYMLSQVGQFLLRGRAYAEIVNGPSGFVEQLLPRHPDRVTVERLPSGRVRYKLTESSGTPRYLTQDEMHVVTDLSWDGGLTTTSRVQYGAPAIAIALAAEAAAGKFFRSGMTAAKVATYTGEMDPNDEVDLHASITRFATGVENNFGLMLVPDNITITNLGVEPDKAQMMLAREWGVREVARQLRIPGYKLGIKDSQAYASQVQAAIDYVISCLRPISVMFEQAIQRDLILAPDTYFAEMKLEALLRGDPDAQASYIEKLIKVRVMRPSEARLILNMNPDPALDLLSEHDFRPGATSNTGGGQHADRHQSTSRGALRGMLAVHDNAMRCLRRERAAVSKLAVKHEHNPAAWQQALREFYAEHAQFVTQTMRLDPQIARGYAAQHGSEFEAKGVVLIAGDAGAEWERFEADELAALALTEGHSADDWFDRRLATARVDLPVPPTPITVNAPVSIGAGAVQVDARTTVEGARVDVKPANVTIQKGAVQVEIQKSSSTKAISFTKNAEGDVEGARVVSEE